MVLGKDKMDKDRRIFCDNFFNLGERKEENVIVGVDLNLTTKRTNI